MPQVPEHNYVPPAAASRVVSMSLEERAHIGPAFQVPKAAAAGARHIFKDLAPLVALVCVLALLRCVCHHQLVAYERAVDSMFVE
eukprot:SAG31_NODE_2910_length_4916_cov_3.526545_1_plen_85_part_00